MKKLTYLILFLLFPCILPAQWQVQNSGTNSILLSVYFIDEDIGFVAGRDGTVLKTINGGNNWEHLYVATNANLTSVFFIDNQSGYIVGDSGVILKTIDGGQNWSIQVTDTDFLSSVFFTSQEIGYIAGYQSTGGVAIGKILKTVDNGNTWTPYTIGTKLSSINFPSSNIGYAVGNGTSIPPSSHILKTIDGGGQWNYRAGLETSLYSVFFTDDTIGYAIGEEWINKTTNGGISWESDSVGQIRLFSIFFPTKDIGYTVGTNYESDNAIIYKTIDGGSSWDSQYNEVTNPLLSVYFVSNDTGYAVGSNGTIIKTTNGGTTGIYNYKIDSQLFVTYPNPATSTLTIELATHLSKDSYLKLLNTNGQPLITQPITEPQTEIDISHLPSGIYIIEVWDYKDVMVRKIIKQ